MGGRDRRLIDVAVEESLDVLDAIAAARADGVVTLAELERIAREAREAVAATERANAGELVMAAMLREGGVGPRLRRTAREVGLRLVEIGPVDPVAAVDAPDHGPLEAA